MSELTQLTIKKAHDLLKAKKISSVELTKAFLQRIQNLDKKLGAFVTLDEEGALKSAQLADEAFSQGRYGVLTGIPLAPKDIYLTKGLRTTCSSKILENFVPPYSSTVIEKCLQEQAVILGKVNMDEFAMGSTTETSAYGVTRNPWDLNKNPGGSSGGSAVAVSADLCVASLGTDTGGSIRQPASHCNIVGLKPTYGRVSRYGTIAFASSLDQMGPMTKTVEDSAILMNIIAGHDERDSTSSNSPVPDYTKNLAQGVKGLRLGVPAEFFMEGIDEAVALAVKQAIKQFEELGATIVPVSLPHTKYAVATYYIIAPAEASANLSRYDGIRYGLRAQGKDLDDIYRKTRLTGFGDEVKRRILIGTYVLSSGYYDAYYIRAQKARTIIKQDFENAFEKVDAIIGPVTPQTATSLGLKQTGPLKVYMADALTIPANMAGLPAMSLPCGFDNNNMPIGLQIIGKAFDEETILKVAYAYEQSTAWHTMKPLL